VHVIATHKISLFWKVAAEKRWLAKFGWLQVAIVVAEAWTVRVVRRFRLIMIKSNKLPKSSANHFHFCSVQHSGTCEVNITSFDRKKLSKKLLPNANQMQ
jgi:hypothetical protein